MIGTALARRASWHPGPIAAVGVGLLAIIVGRALAATRPADEATPLVLATHLYALVLVSGLLLLGLAVGRLILRRIGLAMGSRVEGGLFGTALGLGGIAYAVLAVGLLGFLTPPVLAGIVAGLVVLARHDLVAVVGELPSILADGLALRQSIRAQNRLIALTVPVVELLFAALLIQAMVPPTANDVLTYHLGGPKRFLELGRIAPLIDIEQANMPLTINLLYLLGLAVGSDELGSVLHLTLTILVTAATFSFGRRYFGARIGWIAAVVSISTLMLVVFATVPNVEWGLALFDFLGVYAFCRWHETHDRRWLLVSGLLIGLSMGSKYLGAISALALGLGLSWQVLRERSRLGMAGMLGLLLTFAVPAGLIAAPWYLKNLLWMGNPLWPLLGADPNDFNIHGQVVRFGGGLLGELAIPFRLYLEGSAEYSGIRPPAALLLLPLYVMLPKHRLVNALLALAVFQFVVWAQTAHILRYLTQVWPELSLVAAYVLAELWRSTHFRGAGRWLAGAVLVGGLLVPTVLTVAVVLGDGPFAQLVGLESRQTYLDRKLQNNRLVTALNNQGDAVTGVLMVGDDRGFYLRVPSWIDVSLVEFQRLAAARDADEARAHLRRLGVSHVLVNTRDLAWYMRWDPEHRIEGWLARFEATRSGYLVVEATNEDSTLYRVIDGAGTEAAADTDVSP